MSLFYRIIVFMGVFTCAGLLSASDVTVLAGKYSDGQIVLDVVFESDYQMEVVEKEMKSWSYHHSRFTIRALNGQYLGKKSYVIYKKKKHYFTGEQPDKTGFYTKSKTLYIDNKGKFRPGNCQVVYTIKDKSGRVLVNKRNLYLNAKYRDGKMDIREIKG